jgi:hypothetical protein
VWNIFPFVPLCSSVGKIRRKMDLDCKFFFRSWNDEPYLRTGTYHKLEFEVLTAVFMDVTIFCDITPDARMFLSHLFFYPEDGNDKLISNIGSHTDYKALYPRRWQHSALIKFVGT